MSNDPHLDNPSVKLLETLRKRDKLQSPVEREAASFVEESETLVEMEMIEEEIITAPEDPFDDLEDAANAPAEKALPQDNLVEEKPVKVLSADRSRASISTETHRHGILGSPPSTSGNISTPLPRLGSARSIGVDTGGVRGLSM